MFDHFEQRIKSYRSYLFWGLSGAVAPDTDVFYNILLDPKQTNHHNYFTHYFSFWGPLLLFSLFLLLISKKSNQYPVFFLLFSFGGFFHLMLDMVSGYIFIPAPFLYLPFGAYLEKNHHYREYGIEASIVIWALYLLIRDKKIRDYIPER